MHLRLLLTFGLVLSLSTIATSNECRHYCGHICGAKAAAGTKASAETTPGRDKTAAPAASDEYSMLLTSKLLYI